VSVRHRFDLGGLVALVTGASSGIGRRMAGALAAAGASVVLVARRSAALEEAADEIEAAGGKASYVAVDLEDREQLPRLAADSGALHGPPDILVNGAGINLRQRWEDISFDSWDRTLNLNLAVPFFLARSLVPAMRERGWGRIINIASLQSQRAFPDSAAYGSSKGGVAQLTRAMAEAWSRFGIACNAIGPGFFPTGLTRPVFDDPQREAWAAERTAAGRNGLLEDLDGITVFLASSASDYITGQVIYVDGGFTAK
jgi:gluconate 5-dehydrogenase